MQPWLKAFAICVLASLLAACGSTRLAPEARAPHKPAAAGTASSAPALPPARSGRGGYYQDDGPPDNPPADLLATPDAVPRVEPLREANNRPYEVFGQTYTPITASVPFKQRGFGTWYGKKFHGQKTSSGEKYDMYKMSAAHPTLPIPSYARVTNLSNGAQVIVRINDRGPFHSTRIIDLSYTAALKLGYLGSGSSELEVERLLPEDIARLSTNSTNPPARLGSITPAQSDDIIGALISSGARDEGLGGASGIYLQFGAWSKAANAHALRNRLLPNWAEGQPLLEIVEYGAMFRLYSGPYASRAEAETAAATVRASGLLKPIIVTR